MIYKYKYNNYWQLTDLGLYCNVTNDAYHTEYIPVDMEHYDYYADTRITIDKTNRVYIGWYTYDENKNNYTGTGTAFYEYVVSSYTQPCINKRFIKLMFNISHPNVKFIRTRLLNNYRSSGDEGCSVTIHSLRLIEVPKGTQIIKTLNNGLLNAADFRTFDNLTANFAISQMVESNDLFEY